MADDHSLKAVMEAHRAEKDAVAELFNMLRMLGFHVDEPRGFHWDATFSRGNPMEIGSGQVSVSYSPLLASVGKPSCTLSGGGGKFTFCPVNDLDDAIEAVSMLVEQIKAEVDVDRVNMRMSSVVVKQTATMAMQKAVEDNARRHEQEKAMVANGMSAVDARRYALGAGLQNAYPAISEAVSKRFAMQIDQSMFERSFIDKLVGK